MLLVPIIQPASRREQQLLEENQDLLKTIGLTVEIFGENEVAIRSIPMILGQPQTGSLLREIIDQLESERGVISIEKRRNALLALACKKAVRRNERLSEGDLQELVVRMVDNNVTPTSPRGTPLIVALSHSELDRRFRRLQ
jgi:DNA mismatch repair protein MutL